MDDTNIQGGEEESEGDNRFDDNNIDIDEQDEDEEWSNLVSIALKDGE